MPTELGPVITTLKQKSTEFHSQDFAESNKAEQPNCKKWKNKQVLTINYVKLAFSFFHYNLCTTELIFSTFFQFLRA